MTRIWAHRGASAYAPENTLEAFQLAVKMGADGVELDVHLSRDGEVVVCHDETIDRTSNGKGRIVDKTLAELKTFDFGARYADYPEYVGAKIPTLKEVYRLLYVTGLTVNVELKTDSIEYPDIERKCVEIAQEYGMTDRVLYSSFNHKSLKRLLAVKPDALTGLLYGLKDIPDAEHYAVSQRAAALHPYYPHMLKDGAVARAHALGVKVHPWTIDAEPDIRRLLDLGVDAIITNKPDVALAQRDR